MKKTPRKRPAREKNRGEEILNFKVKKATATKTKKI